jgi:hypothetical protein
MYEVIAILRLFECVPVVVLERFKYVRIGCHILHLYACQFSQFLSFTNVRKIHTQ